MEQSIIQSNKPSDMIQDIKFRLVKGIITKDQAIVEAKPIVDAINEVSMKLAKQYKVTPKKVSVESVLR